MLPIAFTSPLMMLALVALPALWILLRLVPPRPTRIPFPPLRLMLDLIPTEETPARTPWWLTLLRLAIAAFVIVMLAGPLWRPDGAGLASSGPLLVILDNGWAAAPDWPARIAAVQDRLDGAARTGRPVALLATAEPPSEISLATVDAARDRLRALRPEPWTPDRGAHAASVERFLAAQPAAELVWVSDGLGGAAPDPLATRLAPLLHGRGLAVLQGRPEGPLALAGADNAPAGMSVRVLRANEEGSRTGTVRALDVKGLPLGEARFEIAPGAGAAPAAFDMPVDLRNDVTRLEIAGEQSAGAVQLLDDRWRRRTVGIASGQSADVAQPLLSGSYYIGRALESFADVRPQQGASPAEAIGRFVDDKLPVIVLSDIGNLGEAEHRLATWVEGGGVLVRFAGTRLAASADTLVPVTLRRGGRTLGGALSWEKPQALGAFPAGTPFAGLAVPADVSVTRQVLAEPDADLPDRTWAMLADGTPLVTAGKRGKGVVVLFHVTADTTWSNLPLSGVFVEMLRRVVALSGTSPSAAAQGGAATAPVMVAPSRTLDGRGEFEAPPPTAQPVRADAPGTGRADHPPGFYGPADGLVAVNALAKDAMLSPLSTAPLAATVSGLVVQKPRDLGLPLLLAALMLLMADGLIVLVLAGGPVRLRRFAGGATVLLAAVLVLADAQRAPAQSSSDFEGALKTRLAYVVTGDAATDEESLAGLRGLTAVLAERTALEPGPPVGLDIGHDELAFEALIYWPIVAGAPVPPPATMARVDAFMKSGGTIIFDTRDALEQGPGLGTTPAGETLQKLLASLDIPELEPIPHNHVLTKAFYLLDKFPGRYDSGETWVEALPAENGDDPVDRPARAGDGVSPVIITSNDLAAAWAVGTDMAPLYPLTPGGSRQRELAFRAGVNIAMYALTGNYKADQVHVPALLERLGQ